MAAHWGSVTQKLRALHMPGAGRLTASVSAFTSHRRALLSALNFVLVHVPGAGRLTASVSAFTSHRRALLSALNFLLVVVALYFCFYLKQPIYGAFVGLLGATIINHRWLGSLRL